MILKFLKSSYANIKKAFAKTGSLLGAKLRQLFSNGNDTGQFEGLEKLFYEADLGVETSKLLTEKVSALQKEAPQSTPDDYMQLVRETLLTILAPGAPLPSHPAPHVVMVVGVNGNGKTTSVAKLAKRYKEAGQNVMVAAADTFRAAAISQLEIWAQKIGIDIVKGAPNADPAAVAFDAFQAAKARGADVLTIDTAGRLHTKIPLMQELDKIRRVCRKIDPEAPHEVLIVLDATTGQNALDQTQIFHQYVPLHGLILTKLDGSARGGMVVAIQRKTGIPVKFIGVGEGADDLLVFDSEEFVNTLLSE